MVALVLRCIVLCTVAKGDDGDGSFGCGCTNAMPWFLSIVRVIGLVSWSIELRLVYVGCSLHQTLSLE